MVNLLEAIIDELNEKVLSGKFGVNEIYGDLIRELFHLNDDVRDYIFYEMDSKVQEKYNLHKDTPTEEYLWNLTESITILGESYYRGELVEVFDDFDVENNTLTFGVLTLTAYSEPEVNAYDNGEEAVQDFIKDLKELIQIDNITYVEDWDFDEYGCGPSKSGDIIIKIGGR